MKGGYAGKLLFVDLTKGTLQEKPLSEELARNFIGGYGIGARLLYDMMKPGVDPSGPGEHPGFDLRTAQRYRSHVRRPVHGCLQITDDRRME